MHLKNRILSALVIALLALPVRANDVVKCSAKELPTHAFVYDGISIQITELNGYKLFDRERKFSARARVTLSLENKTTHVRKFEPQALSYVGKDGLQVFPVFERNLADDTLPMVLLLAPGAHASTEYALTGRLTFPARIYLGGALVAEVSE